MPKKEWKQLAMGKHNLRIAMDWLHDSFKDAPVLGSLINPPKTAAAKLVQWDDLSRTLVQALKQEENSEHKETQQEVAVVAQGLTKAATLLAGRYQWVITNVPYLARGKQNESLRDFCESNYSAAKNDLATVFLDRCLELCAEGGTSSIVLPQNWLFLTSYKKFREKLLKNDTWHLIARLGPQSFQTPMWDFNVQLITLSSGNSTKEVDGLFGDITNDNLIRGVDVSDPRTAAEKATQLLTAEIKSVEQVKQLENPDARVMLEVESGERLLELDTIANQGIKTGDDYRWRQNFWERSAIINGWRLYQSTVDSLVYYGGRSAIIDWRHEGIGMPCRRPTNQNVGTTGIAVSQMRKLPPTLYTGELYDSNVGPISPRCSFHLSAIWCFCSSPEYNEAVRRVDQKLNVTNATLVKVPFDLDYWTKVAVDRYPNGLPKPYTDYPNQWIFHGHPCGSVIWDEARKCTVHGPLRIDDTVLHVAVARLLGYRWPAELDTSMSLAGEQREWANRCDELVSFADDDGIVCISPVRGEDSASDRLLNLLITAYGDAWTIDTLATLLKSADHADKTLETWLREKFFDQHCKLFQHRPFIWHIWDGLRDGFAALVNYHKLDTKLMETLVYTYLGDWISRQQQDIASGVDGAQERLAAAERLKKKLELILEGEKPYDIFVRWKPLEQQPIGWNPDINDGVRLNIRPFLSIPDIGKKGTGVLRDKPNISWRKDRGKDVESAPWYHVFEGDRINEHHLTLAEKRIARKAPE